VADVIEKASATATPCKGLPAAGQAGDVPAGSEDGSARKKAPQGPAGKRAGLRDVATLFSLFLLAMHDGNS